MFFNESFILFILLLIILLKMLLIKFWLTRCCYILFLHRFNPLIVLNLARRIISNMYLNFFFSYSETSLIFSTYTIFYTILSSFVLFFQNFKADLILNLAFSINFNEIFAIYSSAFLLILWNASFLTRLKKTFVYACIIVIILLTCGGILFLIPFTSANNL